MGAAVAGEGNAEAEREEGGWARVHSRRLGSPAWMGTAAAASVVVVSVVARPP